jgi:predicted ATPase
MISPQPLTPSPQAEAEAEACFLKAIEVAQRQQAKSLELRATTSLARLWQSQGKQREAHRMLAKVYGWFTEGFDTKDLQEAKTLLEGLEN